MPLNGPVLKTLHPPAAELPECLSMAGPMSVKVLGMGWARRPARKMHLRLVLAAEALLSCPARRLREEPERKQFYAHEHADCFGRTRGSPLWRWRWLLLE